MDLKREHPKCGKAHPPHSNVGAQHLAASNSKVPEQPFLRIRGSAVAGEMLSKAMGTRAVQPPALGRGVQGVLLSDSPAAPLPFAQGVQTSLCTEHRPLSFQVLTMVKDHSGCPSSCFLAWRSRSGHTNARGNEKRKGGGRCEISISPLEVCSSRRAQAAGPGVGRVRDNHKRVESAAARAEGERLRVP